MDGSQRAAEGVQVLRQQGMAPGDVLHQQRAARQFGAGRQNAVQVRRMAADTGALEARGLDASPAVRNKLVGIGDQRGAAILDIILRDEIGHVAVGNRWYAYLCAQRQLDPVQTYAELTQRYDAPRLRGPFNLSARRAAGFSEAELAALSQAAAK